MKMLKWLLAINIEKCLSHKYYLSSFSPVQPVETRNPLPGVCDCYIFVSLRFHSLRYCKIEVPSNSDSHYSLCNQSKTNVDRYLKYRGKLPWKQIGLCHVGLCSCPGPQLKFPWQPHFEGHCYRSFSFLYHFVVFLLSFISLNYFWSFWVHSINAKDKMVKKGGGIYWPYLET